MIQFSLSLHSTTGDLTLLQKKTSFFTARIINIMALTRIFACMLATNCKLVQGFVYCYNVH